LPSYLIHELEECLVLCNTGLLHDSGEVHHDQNANFKNGKISSYLEKTAELSYDIKNQLLRGILDEFGMSLHQAWNLKKQFSEKISNKYIDKMNAPNNYGKYLDKMNTPK
jgi:D-glycero-alpha-D-manno-heptose-7-phosphate kinase